MQAYHLLIIGVFILFQSCQNSDHLENGRIVIAGQIKNAVDEPLDLYEHLESLASTTTDQNGRFHFSLEGEEGGYYFLGTLDASLELFLEKGDSIYIETDLFALGGEFSAFGHKEKENSYLREKQKMRNEGGVESIMELMKLSTDDYLTKLDSIEQINHALLNQLSKEKGVSELFIKLERADIRFSTMLSHYNYPMYYSYFNDNAKTDELAYIKEGAIEELGKVALVEPELLMNNNLKELLNEYVESIAQEKIVTDTSIESNYTNYIKTAFAVSDSLFEAPFVRDYLKYKLLSFMLQINGPEGSETLYDSFKATNSSTYYDRKLKALYSRWESLEKGKPVPDFSFETLEGDEVKLSSLQGNLIYIDIWATWCSPCIAEHPFWEELKDEYKGQDVAFVNISIDDDKDAWKRMVVNKKMLGHQWYAVGAWSSPMADHFMMYGIPRFILLDRSGKMIKANAERPSGKIRATLDAYLSTNL